MTHEEHLAKEAHLTAELRRVVLERDHEQCVACGRGGENILQLHHLVYRSQGGTHTEENLATLCRDCHDDVHAGLLDVAYLEWYPGVFSFFCRRVVPPKRWRTSSRVSA